MGGAAGGRVECCGSGKDLSQCPRSQGDEVLVSEGEELEEADEPAFEKLMARAEE